MLFTFLQFDFKKILSVKQLYLCNFIVYMKNNCFHFMDELFRFYIFCNFLEKKIHSLMLWFDDIYDSLDIFFLSSMVLSDGQFIKSTVSSYRSSAFLSYFVYMAIFLVPIFIDYSFMVNHLSKSKFTRFLGVVCYRVLHFY